MILKVKSVAPTEIELVVKQSWRFYDKVEGLHFNIYESGEKLKESAKRWGIPSDVQTVYYEEPKPAESPMLFASFHSESTGPMHLFCDTECYLLNDNGRTIERLI